MESTQPRRLARSRIGPMLFAAAALVGMLAALIVAGQSSATTTSVQVKAGTTKLGRTLLDARGRTLYMFAVDKRSKSACYGVCASFWPPLLSSTAHVSETGLKASLLGTTKRTDGKLQVTYGGHPLYRFAEDAKAGQTKGQDLNIYGGRWWAMSPAGTPIKHTAATGGGGGGGGGYGYGYGG